VPDVHIVWDGIPFWMELKVAKSNKVNISPHQVAWNMAYWARGGLNFYLVKRASTQEILLFGGNQGPEVRDQGCLAPCALRAGSVPDLFCALRPVLLGLLRPNHGPRAVGE